MRNGSRAGVAAAFVVGVGIGVAAGGAEALLVPLAAPLRVPWILAVDGLLGGVLGAGLAMLPGRRATLPRVTGGVAFVPAFVAAALLVNRVLLRDVHHLEPVSLAMDLVALGAAVAVAVGVARAMRRAEPRLRALGLGRRSWAAVPLVILLGVAVLPFVRSRGGDPDPDRPPVIVVSIDTLRPDRLGDGGQPLGTSPELDRLCRQARTFPEAFAVSPGSGASHAALMTSRYPVSNGVHTNFSVLDPSVTTLAERLAARGYRTGGFVTNIFLGQRFGFPQGFDTYVQTGGVERLAKAGPTLLVRSLALMRVVDRVRSRLDPAWDPSFEAALAWMRESNAPTFLFVHLMDVHSPYVPPRPWRLRFGADRSGDASWAGESNAWGWRRSEESYVAEVASADAKIGRLRRALDDVGWLDDGILVLTSDHGENLADHAPHFSHGATLYDATIRILFALRAPGRIGPGRDNRLVENVDLVPTLEPLLGAGPDEEWEGQDLLAEGIPPRSRIFTQIEDDFAVRTREEKVVLRADGSRSLIRLDTDPAEKELRTPTGETLARAEAELAAWLEAHRTELYAREGGQVASGTLSPEVAEQLRTLGYLD